AARRHAPRRREPFAAGLADGAPATLAGARREVTRLRPHGRPSEPRRERLGAIPAVLNPAGASRGLEDAPIPGSLRVVEQHEPADPDLWLTAEEGARTGPAIDDQQVEVMVGIAIHDRHV